MFKPCFIFHSSICAVYSFMLPNSMDILAKLDCKRMKDNCKNFSKELIQYVFNPERCKRICENYNVLFLDYLELLKN